MQLSPEVNETLENVRAKLKGLEENKTKFVNGAFNVLRVDKDYFKNVKQTNGIYDGYEAGVTVYGNIIEKDGVFKIEPDVSEPMYDVYVKKGDNVINVKDLMKTNGILLQTATPESVNELLKLEGNIKNEKVVEALDKWKNDITAINELIKKENKQKTKTETYVEENFEPADEASKGSEKNGSVMMKPKNENNSKTNLETLSNHVKDEIANIKDIILKTQDLKTEIDHKITEIKPDTQNETSNQAVSELNKFSNILNDKIISYVNKLKELNEKHDSLNTIINQNPTKADEIITNAQENQQQVSNNQISKEQKELKKNIITELQTLFGNKKVATEFKSKLNKIKTEITNNIFDKKDNTEIKKQFKTVLQQIQNNKTTQNEEITELEKQITEHENELSTKTTDLISALNNDTKSVMFSKTAVGAINELMFNYTNKQNSYEKYENVANELNKLKYKDTKLTDDTKQKITEYIKETADKIKQINEKQKQLQVELKELKEIEDIQFEVDDMHNFLDSFDVDDKSDSNIDEQINKAVDEIKSFDSESINNNKHLTNYQNKYNAAITDLTNLLNDDKNQEINKLIQESNDLNNKLVENNKKDEELTKKLLICMKIVSGVNIKEIAADNGENMSAKSIYDVILKNLNEKYLDLGVYSETELNNTVNAYGSFNQEEYSVVNMKKSDSIYEEFFNELAPDAGIQRNTNAHKNKTIQQLITSITRQNNFEKIIFKALNILLELKKSNEQFLDTSKTLATNLAQINKHEQELKSYNKSMKKIKDSLRGAKKQLESNVSKMYDKLSILLNKTIETDNSDKYKDAQQLLSQKETKVPDIVTKIMNYVNQNTQITNQKVSVKLNEILNEIKPKNNSQDGGKPPKMRKTIKRSHQRHYSLKKRDGKFASLHHHMRKSKKYGNHAISNIKKNITHKRM
jgi:hypothetical protein